MMLERALEIVKWGLYAKPAAASEAEKMEALRLVLAHPEVWDDLMWMRK